MSEFIECFVQFRDYLVDIFRRLIALLNFDTIL